MLGRTCAADLAGIALDVDCAATASSVLSRVTAECLSALVLLLNVGAHDACRPWMLAYNAFCAT